MRECIFWFDGLQLGPDFVVATVNEQRLKDLQTLRQLLPVLRDSAGTLDLFKLGRPHHLVGVKQSLLEFFAFTKSGELNRCIRRHLRVLSNEPSCQIQYAYRFCYIKYENIAVLT